MDSGFFFFFLKTYWGVWKFCKIQYIILYINLIPQPNGSLILSPKSPNLKSQTSLSLSLPQRVRVSSQFSISYRMSVFWRKSDTLSLFLEIQEKGLKIFSGKWLREQQQQQQYFSGEGFSMPPLARKPRPMI